MTEPCDLSALQARRLIGARRLSPLELLDSCLARIARTNPAVNAIVAMDEPGARRQARAAEDAVMRGEPLGLLHGLPIGIKDLEPVAGLRTTWGSLLFKDHVPTQDSGHVARLRAAGAVLLAKTNTPEFGAGANTTNRVYGSTGNPFDPTLTCGGSSGGTATALALGQLPLATGSDYGGSLRIPAAFCGVVGMRPSPGLVPVDDAAVALMPWSVVGPMARSLADAHLLLRAQIGIDRRDPFSSRDALDIPEQLAPVDASGLRVAFSADLGQAPIEHTQRRCFHDKMRGLTSLFRQCEDRTPDFAGVNDIFEVFRALVFHAMHAEKVERHRELIGPNIIDNVAWASRFSLADVSRAYLEQTRLTQRFNRFFDDFDVLIAPTTSVAPFDKTRLYIDTINGEKLANYVSWCALTYIPTMAMAAAVSLPAGLDDKGLPIGLQLIGPKGSDAKLLAIAATIEAALQDQPATRRPVPPMASATA